MDGEDILIAAADEATIGEYHCTATNEFGRGHAEPVKLDITDGRDGRQRGGCGDNGWVNDRINSYCTGYCVRNWENRKTYGSRKMRQ